MSTWIPDRYVNDIIHQQSPCPVDPATHPVLIQGYLREFFETVIRIRAADTRLKRYFTAQNLARCYTRMPLTAVYENLTAFNQALKPHDHARNPPEIGSRTMPWTPLVTTHQYHTVTDDIETYADLIITYAEHLHELRACREVVEAAIAVTCDDARRAYLTREEKTILTRLAAHGPIALTNAYSRINHRIGQLALDRNIDLAPFLHPDGS